MTKAIFFFISCLLLLLPLVFNAGEISMSSQLLFTTPFLLLFGIPHGAIDNVLYLRNNKIKNTHFIAIYLVFVASNIAIWIFSPTIAYVLFLFLSAYHFGQSQFTHYFDKQPSSHKALYLFWGISILSGLLYFNIAETHSIMVQHEEFAVFSPLHQEVDMLYLFLASTLLTVSFIIYLTAKKFLTIENMFMELLVISLVLICFYLLPFLIGFTLYFIVLHSFKVLKEEYHFLDSKKEISSFKGFIQLIAPFTLLSVFGILFLFGLIYLDVLTFSYGYCLLIVISSITLPHVFVMNKFYGILFSSKRSPELV
jgi:Brp/Blh family beta-carotene 15,15'-monooxygenase